MLDGSMSAPPSFWASVNSWFTPTVLFVFLNLTIGTILFTSTFSTKPRRQDDAEAKHLPRSASMLQRIKSVNFYAYRSQEPEESPDSDTHLPPHQTPETEQIDSRSQFQVQPPLSPRSPSINLENYFSQEPTSPIKSESVTGKSPETNNTHSDSERENEMEHETGEEQSTNAEQTLAEVYSQLKVTQVSRRKSDKEPMSGEIPRKMKKSASTKSAFAHLEEEDIVEKRRPATVREGAVKDYADSDEGVDAKADDFINRFKQQLKLQRIDSISRK